MERIGKYRILERIGRGGMGSVFKAYDPVLDRTVALKVISAEGDVTDELRARFFREAQACARLSHPNIVIIHDLGEADRQLFIVMELLEGEELRQLIAQRKFIHLEDKLSVMLQVCNGLDYAHGKGIVHRDIKPGNIFVLRNGQVKILDFGIAHIEAAGAPLTRTGLVMGTLRYMAPEQVRGRTDQRGDIFSVGAVFYELLTSQPAFTGEGPMEILEQLRTQDPTSVVAMDPTLPPELGAIVARALQKEPARRYAGLQEMRADLEQVRGRLAEDAARLRWEVQARLGEFRELEEVLVARLGGARTEETPLEVGEPLRLATLEMVQREAARRIEHMRAVLSRAEALQPTVERGLDALRRGEFHVAVSELEHVVREVPEHARAMERLAEARRELAVQRRREALAALLRDATAAFEAREYPRCLDTLRRVEETASAADMPVEVEALRHAAEGALAAERERARLEAVRRARVAAEEMLERSQQARYIAEAAAAARYAAPLWNAAERKLAAGRTALADEDYAQGEKHLEEAWSLYQRADVAAREARTAAATRRASELLEEGRRLLGEGRFAECLSRIEEVTALVPDNPLVGALRARAEEGLRQEEETPLARPPRSGNGDGVGAPVTLDETLGTAAPIALVEVPAADQAESPATGLAPAPLPSSATHVSEPFAADPGRQSLAPGEGRAPGQETILVPGKGGGLFRESYGKVTARWRAWPLARRAAVAAGIAGALTLSAIAGYFLVARVPQAPTPPKEATDQPAPSDVARTLIEKAREVGGRNPSEAVALLSQAISADPKSVQAYFELGRVYTRLKEYPRAIEAYGRAADLDPNFPEPFFNLGYVYQVTMEFPKAEEMYARVVKLGPRYVDEALYNLAIVQDKQGKRQEAIESLERAVRINPDNKPAERFLKSLKRKP